MYAALIFFLHQLNLARLQTHAIEIVNEKHSEENPLECICSNFSLTSSIYKVFMSRNDVNERERVVI